MRRGTTPTHTFQIPVDASLLEEVKITYAQNGKEVLSKYKEDCKLNGTTVEVTLTQEETLKFSGSKPCQIQVRVLTTGGQACASKIMEEKVLPLLDGEVLK